MRAYQPSRDSELHAIAIMDELMIDLMISGYLIYPDEMSMLAS